MPYSGFPGGGTLTSERGTNLLFRKMKEFGPRGVLRTSIWSSYTHLNTRYISTCCYVFLQIDVNVSVKRMIGPQTSDPIQLFGIKKYIYILKYVLYFLTIFTALDEVAAR